MERKVGLRGQDADSHADDGLAEAEGLVPGGTGLVDKKQEEDQEGPPDTKGKGLPGWLKCVRSGEVLGTVLIVFLTLGGMALPTILTRVANTMGRAFGACLQEKDLRQQLDMARQKLNIVRAAARAAGVEIQSLETKTVTVYS